MADMPFDHITGAPDCACSHCTFARHVPAHVPNHHAAWVASELARVARARECVDNIRVCRPDVLDQIHGYAVAYDGGCCGAYDGAHTHPDGTVYWIGFNYGH